MQVKDNFSGIFRADNMRCANEVCANVICIIRGIFESSYDSSDWYLCVLLWLIDLKSGSDTHSTAVLCRVNTPSGSSISTFRS